MTDKKANEKKSKDDDLDAVRTIVEALKPFKPDEQERIVRWAREKLGLASVAPSSSDTTPTGPASTPSPRPQPPSPGAPQPTKNIRDFVAAKNPSSDNQFAAVAAYYYRFEAPEQERKDAITSDDLQEACRQAGRPRLAKPIKTLHNAHGMGLLDKAERGAFSINSVGENLVAMTLPGGGAASAGRAGPRRKRASPRSSRKKVASTRRRRRNA
jgi:hypothetical protein